MRAIFELIAIDERSRFENKRKEKRNRIFEALDISESFLRNISRRVILEKSQEYFEDNLKMLRNCFKDISRRCSNISFQRDIERDLFKDVINLHLR